MTVLWANVSMLFAAALAGAAWVEAFTDWGPELDGSLALKAGGALGGCALLLLLGKEYQDKLVEIARRVLDSWAATVLIVVLVLTAFAVTLSARTAELQASTTKATVNLTWKGITEPVDVEAGKKKRVVRFTWFWDPLPVTAVAACREERSGSITRYQRWEVKLEELKPSRRLTIQGSKDFQNTFRSGAIPPLDLEISDTPPVSKYLGQPLRLGECTCEKAGTELVCKTAETLGRLKKGVDPKVDFVCAQNVPCTFYANRRRLTYSPGAHLEARITRKGKAHSTDPDLWELDLVLKP